MEHNYDWFSKYIWGEDFPASSTLATGTP
jgi:hypothetical protein